MITLGTIFVVSKDIGCKRLAGLTVVDHKHDFIDSYQDSRHIRA